jgi:uncharacterized membrane protein YozB (DUF420 family)
MTLKRIIQTLGTVSSFILAFFTLKLTRNMHEIDFLNLSDVFSQYGQFLLIILTIGMLMVTGFSYLNSRFEFDGMTRFLYFCLGIAHTLLAPISVIIAVMKIEFGQYWWAVLVGAIILIIWGNQQRESQNN